MRTLALPLPLALLLTLTACPSSGEGPAPPPPPPPAQATPAAPPPAAAAAPAAAPPSGSANEQPDPAKQDLSWTAVSQDNLVALVQTGDLRGKCVAECSRTHDKQLLWRSERCFGTKLDLRFIANDCEKVVVIHQLPKASGIPQQTAVGEVFRRDKREYVINAGATIKDWKKVRSGGTTFYWLAGVLGMPGNPPRYSDDGKAVELETVDGKKHSIPLTVTK